jgi:antitoxin CptB
MKKLEILRKRLVYQSQHRGTKEMDVILGEFAQKHLHSMSFENLKKFEALLALSDQDLQDRLYKEKSLLDALVTPLKESNK